MKRYLKFINVWWSLGVVCLLVACSPNRPQEDKKIVALASVFPLVDWVKQVGDDKVEVIYLPAPDTPHQNFSLSPELSRRISQTDIVFEINRGLDDWLNPILHTHATKKPSIVVLSKRMPALEPYGTQHHIDYDQTLASHQASSLNIDPHIWLDPILAQQMVLHIADALSTINPSADKYFHANAERYMKQLTELHFWIDRKLAGLSQRRLFVVHSSFTYFAYRYNLTLVPLDNILPQQKPAPECIKTLKQILRPARGKVLALEHPLNRELSQTLSEELGVQLIYLDPVGNPLNPERNNYLSLMKYNATQISNTLR